MSKDTEEKEEKNVTDNLPDDIWMVRECELYKEEYDECSNRAGRKHQKYTLGYTIDCSKWKEDYHNCLLFYKKGDIDAIKKVIDNETERYKSRVKAGASNTIWEYRTEPPEDWNQEIPGWDEKFSLFKAYNQGKTISLHTTGRHGFLCSIL